MSDLQTLVQQFNATAALIPTLVERMQQIDAQLSPDVLRPARYETQEEHRARLAGRRGEAKVAAEAAFKREAYAALADLRNTERSARRSAGQRVKREREALRKRHDPQLLQAERERVRAQLAAPSTSFAGDDLAQRVRAEYVRATLADDDLTLEALRREFAEAAHADPQAEGTEADAWRELRHAFREDADATEAQLRAAEADEARVAQMEPQIAQLVRTAEVEAGLVPASGMYAHVERGDWSRDLLGLDQFPEGAIVMPQESAAVGER